MYYIPHILHMYNDNIYAVDVFIPSMIFIMPSCFLCPYSVLHVMLFQLFILWDFWNTYAANAWRCRPQSL